MSIREVFGGFALRLSRHVWPSDRFLWPLARFCLVRRDLKHACGVFQTADQFRMRLSLREYPDGSMYFGVYEVATVRLLRQLVQPNNTVVDVGGNIGYIALHLALRVGSGGTVHTFEPVKETADRLSENVCLNEFASVVRVHRTAVGAVQGEVVMHTFGGDSTGCHVLASMKPLYEQHDTRRAPLEVLDCIVEGPVQLIKVDVEGAEVGVIRGAKRIIGDYHPHLIVENNPETLRAFGHTFRDIAAAVDDAAPGVYVISSIDGILKRNWKLDVDSVCLPRGNLWFRPLRH